MFFCVMDYILFTIQSLLHQTGKIIEIENGLNHILLYSKTCVKQPLSKRPINGFQDRLSLNAGQKYCRMLQREHSAIISIFIKLPVVIKT